MRTGAILASVATLALAVAHPMHGSFGNSKTRARKFRGHGLQLESNTACENVDELYFPYAVVDNYADVQHQKYWTGWGQRYFKNSQYYGGDGYPIFVYIGGEGAEGCGTLAGGLFISTLAQQHGAMQVDLEHRFYGKSYPTTNMDNQNIEVLTSAQALADLARFIKWFKQDNNITSGKVITFGGSYPGNLAAWFRLKYPHITSGSVASSAPVIAEENFEEYMEVVANGLRWYGGASCYDAFEAAAEAVQAKITANDLETLEADFKTCKPLDGDKDVATLLSMLMGNVQGTAQYNNERATVMNLADICETMTAGPDAYTQFVALNDLYLAEYGEECTDASYQDFIDYLNTVTFDETSNYRQWYYQTCNEFGYYQTTDSEDQPFHSWTLLDLKYYTDVCSEVYGYTKSPQIDWINDYYGGVSIEGTNIVFPTGTIDPWHVLGVTNTTDLPMDSEHDALIVGTAHCADMYAPAPTDPEALTEAREDIAEYVSEFLTESGDEVSSKNVFSLLGREDEDEDEGDDDDEFSSATVAVVTVVIGAVIAISGVVYFYRKVQALEQLEKIPVIQGYALLKESANA